MKEQDASKDVKVALGKDARLIGNNICPYCQRTKLALIVANISVDYSDIGFVNKPEWLEEYSPLNKIPVLLTDYGALFGSTAIVKYLTDTDTDSRFYQSRLLGLVDLIEEAHELIRSCFNSSEEDFHRKQSENVKNIIDVFLGSNRSENWSNGTNGNVLNIFLLPLLFLVEVIEEVSPWDFWKKNIFQTFVESNSIKDELLSVFDVDVRHSLIDFICEKNFVFVSSGAMRVEQGIFHE